jgi:hypothetical protein
MVWLTSAEAKRLGIEVALLDQSTTANLASHDTRSWLVKDGIDLFGFDLQGEPVTAGNASQCESKCRSDSRCRAYTSIRATRHVF